MFGGLYEVIVPVAINGVEFQPGDRLRLSARQARLAGVAVEPVQPAAGVVPQDAELGDEAPGAEE